MQTRAENIANSLKSHTEPIYGNYIKQFHEQKTQHANFESKWLIRYVFSPNMILFSGVWMMLGKNAEPYRYQNRQNTQEHENAVKPKC